MTLTQFLLVLRARWMLVLGTFGLVIAATIAVSLLMTTVYTASATVVAEIKADPLSLGAGGYAVQTSTAYIATQVDIISSKRVAQRVAKNLKLDQSPEYISRWRTEAGGQGDILVWLGDILQKTLVVTPSRDSSVIEIAVTWRDRNTAAALANAFAQAYLDTSIELRTDPAKQYAVYFEDRAKVLRADLQAKQKRLSDFESKTGIVATTDARMDIENARLTELSTQLLTIQALRQDSQSRQRQAAGDTELMPEVLQSPVIATLKTDLATAEAKLQDIGTNLGKNHPDYKTQVAEVASIRQRIEQESGRIAASLGATTQVNLRKESDIRAALEAQKEKMLDLTHQHDEVSVLQSDVETAQRNLDAVTQHLAQSNLESDTQQTNISLLTAAVPPTKRSSPKYSLNLAIGVFIGAVLGMGAALFREFRDGRLRQSEDMTRLIGAPLIARIPGIQPGDASKRSLTLPGLRIKPSGV
jgi:chain length determinant protein EpsF